MTSSPSPCPTCGALSTGSFCGQCGASLAGGRCGRCRADLTPGARFCHRCGEAQRGGAGPSERRAWLFASGLVVVLLGVMVVGLVRQAPEPVVPDMANTGSSGGGPIRPASDISAMSPRERFDRLFQRLMLAGARRDSVEIVNFTPMALGAYRLLDAFDEDARFHAALIQIQVGAFPEALALADTILAAEPRHLFGLLLRGTVADLRGDRAALRRTYAAYAAAYDAERRAGRPEYAEHADLLEGFRQSADSALRQP